METTQVSENVSENPKRKRVIDYSVITLKQAKQNVSLAKSKLRRTMKDLKKATKHGSPKQQAACEKRFKTAKNQYLRNVVIEKNVRKNTPSVFQKIKTASTGKKILTYTGLAVTLALTGAAAFIAVKGRPSQSGENQTDNMWLGD